MQMTTLIVFEVFYRSARSLVDTLFKGFDDLI